MEKLEQLGERLQAAREYRGFSLEDLSKESRVAIEHIRNLEAANREALPEEAFTTGFLTKICKSLGIKNSDLVLDEFKQAEADHVLADIVNDSGRGEKSVETGSYKAWIYTLVIAALLAAAWFVYDVSFKQAQNTKSISRLDFVKEEAADNYKPKKFGRLRKRS
ncbi:MAG: helix-turn-helix domain-containing protein [Candidatus Melainabacteria bacterium]|nr:helix-turn-helix domain-containing protein [Candidatus Melainabacteria bacterium]